MIHVSQVESSVQRIVRFAISSKGLLFGFLFSIGSGRLLYTSGLSHICEHICLALLTYYLII